MSTGNPANSALFETTFQALQGQGPLKTWSLIVTIFGDIAPARDGLIDSQLLAALTAPFGVKPEALRVALHRLRKDGWLEAVKTGRRSAYHLSPTGEALTRAAYVRIYRAPESRRADWQITLVEDATREAKAGSVAIGPNILVAPATPAAPLALAAEDVPDWMRAALMPPEALVEFSLYTKALRPVLNAASGVTLCAQDRLALRLLVLHTWRRIILRQPELPEALLGEDWAGFEARRLTHALFEALPRVSLCELAALQNA